VEPSSLEGPSAEPRRQRRAAWICTRIYDRETGEILYGRVPPGSVVVSGNLPSADGKYSLYCAVIVKKVDEKTRAKTSLNELLRL
jgi:2,3,4,5-tetrahydropyridine-2-carboxylate N-succinyltransferase